MRIARSFVMRTHLQIIADAGGYQGLAKALDLPAERVRFWKRRESIPMEEWPAVEAAGIASHAELFGAALARKTTVQGRAA